MDESKSLSLFIENLRGEVLSEQLFQLMEKKANFQKRLLLIMFVKF